MDAFFQIYISAWGSACLFSLILFLKDKDSYCVASRKVSAFCFDALEDSYFRYCGYGPGYVYHTVPVAVYAWYKHFGDFEQTLSAVLNCGGDTDTSGAIAGTLAGAVVGQQGIPIDWLKGIFAWPRGPNRLTQIADEFAEKCQLHPHLLWPPPQT